MLVPQFHQPPESIRQRLDRDLDFQPTDHAVGQCAAGGIEATTGQLHRLACGKLPAEIMQQIPSWVGFNAVARPFGVTCLDAAQRSRQVRASVRRFRSATRSSSCVDILRWVTNFEILYATKSLEFARGPFSV